MTAERCVFCNRALKRGSYRKLRKGGRYCRSQGKCFIRVIDQIHTLGPVGQRMSNVLFNLAQSLGGEQAAICDSPVQAVGPKR